MKLTHILWDFNGTILDDVQIGIDSVNILLEKRGLPVIPDAAYYRSVFGFPITAYYERLGFDFTREPFNKIAVEWVAEYLNRAKNASLCPGAAEALRTFRDAGFNQVMLSATEKRMLAGQLETLGITAYFSELLGLDNIHAASKVGLAQEWAERNSEAAALLIGDTEHDAEVADAIGVPCILIEGGHQMRETLSATGKKVFPDLFEAASWILQKSTEGK